MPLSKNSINVSVVEWLTRVDFARESGQHKRELRNYFCLFLTLKLTVSLVCFHRLRRF